MLRYFIYILFLFCLTGTAFGIDGPPETLIQQYIHKYEALERFNNENEKAGRKDLNQYVIELDTTNWIEESPTRYYLNESYNRLKKALVDFNKERSDSLRFYVVVVNNYYAMVKESVNLDSLPKYMTNITQYVKYDTDAEDKYDYKYFMENSAKVMERITKEFKKNNYANRIIYSCSILQFYNYDREIHLVLSDNLLIDGPKLKSKSYAIRSRAKVNWSTEKGKESFSKKIEKGVYNIINAVRLVVDAGIDNDADIAMYGCRISLGEATAKTKGKRDSLFASQAVAVAKLLDNPSESQRHKSDYVIVDNISAFPDKDLLFNYILPDKIGMVSSVYSKFSMFVVFKEIPFAMLPAEWITFAEKVYNNSTVVKDRPNVLLLVVPYYRGSCKFTNMLGQEVGRNGMLLFPSVYCPTNQGVAGEMNAAFAAGSTLTDIPTSPWSVAFNEAFKRIPKKYHIYGYKFLWDGSLIYDGEKELTNVTGSKEIVEVELVIDDRYEDYQKLLRDLQDAVLGQKNSSCVFGDCEAVREFNRKLTELKNSPPKNRLVSNTNLVQSKLNELRAFAFVKWYTSRMTQGAIASLGAPDDDVFYGGENMIKVMDNLAILDNVSIVASFVGLDVIFDSYGAYYAYKHGLYEEAALYGLGAGLPLVCGGSLRKALKKGEQIVTKTFKNKFVVISAELSHGGAPVKNLSEFTVHVLDGEAVSQVAKHEDDIPFVESLEDGLLSDEKVIKQVNEKPELIEDFHEFHAKERGDVKAFIAHRENVVKLGLDPDVMKSFERIAEEPGWFTVIVHGSADGSFLYKLGDGEWYKLDHRALATFMKKNGYTTGMPVRLVSCSSGSMDHALAQDLSNKLGAVVKAPDVKVGVDKLGRVVAAEPGAGQWRRYKPGDYTVAAIEAPVAKATAGETITSLGDIAYDEALVVENAVNSFQAQKSDDLIKKVVTNEKDDPAFLKDVFGSNPQPDQFVGASQRDYITPFHNLKVDGSSLPEYAKYKDVKYFNETERLAYEVKVKNGQWYVNGQLPNDDKVYIFVMDKKGNIYMGESVQGQIHHSSFVAGDNVALAGSIDFKNGKINMMDNISGHYQPNGPALDLGMGEFLREMGHRGVDVKGIKYTQVAD